MSTKTELLTEWNNITLIKIFEMPVVNRETENDDWIVWNIEADENGIKAYASESLDTSSVSWEWDESFSLDEHLATLHDLCWDAVDYDNTFAHREDE